MYGTFNNPLDLFLYQCLSEEKQEYRDKYNNTSPYSECPDDDVFRHISLTYSQSHPTMHDYNKTQYGDPVGGAFVDGITNGADWYPLTGKSS